MALDPKASFYTFPSSSKYSDVSIIKYSCCPVFYNTIVIPLNWDFTKPYSEKKYKRALPALYCLYIYSKYNVRICIVAVSSNTS